MARREKREEGLGRKVGGYLVDHRKKNRNQNKKEVLQFFVGSVSIHELVRGITVATLQYGEFLFNLTESTFDILPQTLRFTLYDLQPFCLVPS